MPTHLPSPPAIHPFVQAVYILQNKLSGAFETFTPAQYAAGEAAGYTILDAARVPSIPGADYILPTTVNGPLEGHPKDEPLLLVCNRGKQAYFLQNRLKYYGYTNTRVLEGGLVFNEVKSCGCGPSVTPAQIAEVKALGFLFDKRTRDRFNGRIITRNGKITARGTQSHCRGGGAFRLRRGDHDHPSDHGDPGRTLQQHPAYAGFPGGAWLSTGGTGSKVRPVVACKGTTCQYGLIDTFQLSEEIHERFFVGYNNVKLPHKFKIAVGGCPNNCVKPDLNDLGIVGQRVPQVQLDQCKGCKVCQGGAGLPHQSGTDGRRQNRHS